MINIIRTRLNGFSNNLLAVLSNVLFISILSVWLISVVFNTFIGSTIIVSSSSIVSFVILFSTKEKFEKKKTVEKIILLIKENPKISKINYLIYHNNLFLIY